MGERRERPDTASHDVFLLLNFHIHKVGKAAPAYLIVKANRHKKLFSCRSASKRSFITGHEKPQKPVHANACTYCSDLNNSTEGRTSSKKHKKPTSPAVPHSQAGRLHQALSFTQSLEQTVEHNWSSVALLRPMKFYFW